MTAESTDEMRPDPDDEESRIDELAAQYIDRILAGERIDPLDVLLENPGIGHEILESLKSFLAVGREDFPSGRRLGDFTLLRELGRGGMGVVYEARQESMGRGVALKILPVGIAADRTAFLRFLREAQAAGKLHHPTIVPVYSMGVEAETPYYAMELLEGETLAEVISRRREGAPVPGAGIFSAPEIDLAWYVGVAKAFAEVAEGLHHAHREGVIHRDIKPSNLMVVPGGSLRILDFGLAHLGETGTLTLKGETLGTPLYMSPEQARRETIPVDHRTDIYSLGATLYETLTLHPPFRGRDRRDILRQVVECDPPPLRSQDPRVPRDLETVVLKCLRKEPEGRYGTAGALAQDLRRFGQGEPIEARPQSGWEKLRRRAWRHRVALAVSFAFLIAAGAAGWLAHRSERLAEEAAVRRYREDLEALVADLSAGQFSLKGGLKADLPALFLLPWTTLAPAGPDDLSGLLEPSVLAPIRERVKSLQGLVDRIPAELSRDGRYHLARAYGLLGEEERAREQALRALAIDPAFAPARALLKTLQDSGGDPGGARGAGEPMPPSEVGPGTPGWVPLWRAARRAMESTGDWAAAAEAYGALIDLSRSPSGVPGETGEPYAGLRLEAFLGRGIALLRLEDFDRAREHFAVARELARASLEAPLLLAKAYLREGKKKGDEVKRKRADAELASLFHSVPPGRRDETALWISLVLFSEEEFRAAAEWAGQIQAAPLGVNIAAYAWLRAEAWEEAVEAARRAAASAPEDLRARNLLVKALLERAARGGPRPSECQEHLELLEEARRASESFPESRYTGVLLRMAREAVRKRIEGLSKEETMYLRRGRGCWALVGAVVGSLGLAGVASERGYKDDFCDEDVFDCKPRCWNKGPWSQGEFIPLGPPECGLAVRAMGEYEMTLGSSDVFSGQVRIRVTGTFNGTKVATGGGGYYPFIGQWLHVDSATLSGYNGELFATGDLWIEKWSHGSSTKIKGKAGFDPMEEVDLEVAVELQAVEIPPAQPGGEPGQRIDLRAWRPEKEPRPAEAQVAIDDGTLRMGTVALGSWTTIGAERPIIIRSFEVEEIATSPTFRRGDANADGTADLNDGIDLLGYLFLGSDAPSCLDAADSNDDGALDISDAISILGYLFLTGRELPAPGPEICGPDPIDDGLDCVQFPQCE